MTALKCTLPRPEVIERQSSRLSPWVTVMARTLTIPGKVRAETYHSLRQADYVGALALTPDGRIPLVRQYRPALEAYTLELPGGLRDGDEAPELCALRELTEETGLIAIDAPRELGCLSPDTGRLENHLWAYAVHVVAKPAPQWQPEAGVESILVTRTQLRNLILDGHFNHALHIALIGLGVLHGFLDLE